MAMVKPRLAFLIRILPVLAVVSCVPPKATVVQEAPKKKEPEPEVLNVAPNLPAPADDPLRLPDLTTIPGDNEFKASVPTPANSLPGTINVRPPTEPPPRQKPKTEE